MFYGDPCPRCGATYGPLTLGLDDDPAEVKALEQRRLTDQRRNTEKEAIRLLTRPSQPARPEEGELP